jgi:hypothetical protein
VTGLPFDIDFSLLEDPAICHLLNLLLSNIRKPIPFPTTPPKPNV